MGIPINPSHSNQHKQQYIKSAPPNQPILLPHFKTNNLSKMSGSYHLTKEELKNLETSTTTFNSPHEREETSGQKSSDPNSGTRATAKDSGPTDAGKAQQSQQKGGQGQQGQQQQSKGQAGGSGEQGKK